jgi:hypothetical protein
MRSSIEPTTRPAISFQSTHTVSTDLSNLEKVRKSQAVKYCERMGFHLVAFDLKLQCSGLAGRNRNMSGLKQLIEAASRGTIKPGTILIVESLNISSRQDVKSCWEQLLELINTYCFEIHTLYDQQIHKAVDLDPVNLLITIVEIGNAHKRSDIRSRRAIERGSFRGAD